MTLYAASLMDIAEPVKTDKKEKKEKKPLSEKQLAALEKAKETRKRKREEAQAEQAELDKKILEKKEEIRQKELELAEKKKAMAEKRKQKRLEKKQQSITPPPSAPSLDEAIDIEVAKIDPVKEVVKESKPEEPPAWFQKYIEGVKKEEAKVAKPKKARKVIKQEAKDVAASTWNDGLTRDRVQNEVDNHMSKMYSMIFNNRRMK